MNNHLGDTNKMVGEDHIRDATKMVSETPRMDASAYDDGAIWETGCDIERELNAANDRIKRLEEAGDRMRLYCADPDDCFAWDRAKKAKL